MSEIWSLETKLARPAYMIYINGWPGVGKLTVARALQRLIAGSQILHNHNLIDPVEAQYTRGTPEYVKRRSAYRRLRLQEVAQKPDEVYIFTDAQTERNSCVEDHVTLSRPPHDRRFYSVVLECELEDNIRRLTRDGRGGQGNGKLTDPEVLMNYRRTMEIWKFGDSDEIVNDVMSQAPDLAAEMIYDFVTGREAAGRESQD